MTSIAVNMGAKGSYSVSHRSLSKSKRSQMQHSEMQAKFMDQFEKEAQDTVIKNSLETDPDL